MAWNDFCWAVFIYTSSGNHSATCLLIDGAAGENVIMEESLGIIFVYLQVLIAQQVSNIRSLIKTFHHSIINGEKKYKISKQ